MLRSSVLSYKGLWEYFLLVIKAEQGKPDSNCELNAQCSNTIVWISLSLGMEHDGASVQFASLKLKRENGKWVEKKWKNALEPWEQRHSYPLGSSHIWKIKGRLKDGHWVTSWESLQGS